MSKLKKKFEKQLASVAEIDDQAFLALPEDWLNEQEELSFEDVRALLQKVLDEDIPKTSGGANYPLGPAYYLHKIWPDKCVVKKSYGNNNDEDPLFQLYPYSIIDDGVTAAYAELGEPQEVKAMFVPVDVSLPNALPAIREADTWGLDDPSLVGLLEKEVDGGKVTTHESTTAVETNLSEGAEQNFVESFEVPLGEVKLEKTRSGEMVLRNVVVLAEKSKNGRTYSHEVMRKSVPMFENVRAYLDHPSENQKDDPRSVRHLLGRHKNVRFDETSKKVRSDLHLIPNELVEKYLLPIINTDSTLIGNSISAKGKITESGDVTEITHARSVDVVAEPATTSGLWESLNSKIGSEKSTETKEGVTVMSFKIEDILADTGAMTALRVHFKEEFDAEGMVETIQNENAALKEELVKYKTTEKVRELQAEIDALLGESKLPDEIKKDSNLRELLETAKDTEARKGIVARMTKIVESAAASGKKSDPSITTTSDPVIKVANGDKSKPNVTAEVLHEAFEAFSSHSQRL